MTENDVKIKAAEWRGRVSQQLKDMHDDIIDMKQNYNSFEKRMYVCRKDVNKEFDKITSKMDDVSKKVYYLLGAFAVIIILMEIIFR